MNKFKKIMLGALSVLTLGLFVVTGTKANATATTASVYDGTYDYKISIANLTTNTFSVYGTSYTGKTQNVDDSLIAMDSKWNWYDSALSSELSITNGTSHTFNSFAVPTSSRKVTFKVPSGQTKISVEVYLLSLVKAGDSDSKYTSSTSALTATFAASNTTIKVDDATTKVNGLVATIDGDATIHKLSFDYTVSTDVTLQSGLTILGVAAKNVATTGYNINYVSAYGTAPNQETGQTTLPNPLPSMSTKGYTFEGWYTLDGSTSGEWGTKATAGSSLESSITLYAKWSINNSEWCTITFDAGEGTSDKTSDTAIMESSYSLPNASRNGYALAGWSDGTSVYVDTYTVPSSSTVTLTAQWIEKITFNKECKLESSDAVSASDFITITTTSGDPSFQNGKGSASFNGNTFTSSSKGLKFDAKPTLTFTLSESSTVYLLFSTNYSGKKVSLDAPLYTESFAIPSDGLVTLKLAKGSHTIRRGDGEVYLFYIGVKHNKDTASAITSDIAAQFDKDSAPTKLRLVGIINGLQPVEYAEISSVVFTFDFNGNPFTKSCTSIYKSVASVKSTFTAGDYKLYVVLTINGVDKYTADGDKSIENIKMTINFEDGTQKIVTRDNVLLAPKA